MQDSATPSSSREAAGHPWWLLGIITGALALRLHQLTAASLWVDEALTAWLVELPLIEMFKMLKSIEMTPPLHTCLMYGWAWLCGTSELALRLPSVMLGVGSVFMIFCLGRSLYDARTGLLAAALLAVSPYHISYSQEARSYSLLVFLSLWSCWLLSQLVRQPTPWRRVGYVLVTTAMLYTHLYAVFVVLAQAAAFLLVRLCVRDKPALGARDGAHLLLGVGVLYVPWVWVTATWLRNIGAGRLWIEWYGWDTIVLSYSYYAGGYWLLALLAALAVLGVRRYGSRRFGTWLCVALLVSCVVLPTAMSRFWRPFFVDRYGIVALMGLYLLAAAGIATRRRPALVTLAVLIALMLPAAIRTGTSTSWKRTDWRTIGATIEEHAATRDVLVVDQGYAEFALSYYLQRPDLFRARGPRRDMDGLSARDPEARIWVVLWSTDATPEDYVARAGSHYSLARAEDHGGGCTLVELAPR
jgi:mannosyltransferase